MSRKSGASRSRASTTSWTGRAARPCLVRARGGVRAADGSGLGGADRGVGSCLDACGVVRSWRPLPGSKIEMRKREIIREEEGQDS